MATNAHRGTAARLLLVFAALVLLASLVSLRIRWRDGLEYLSYPTAAEDLTYFDTEKGLGQPVDDMFSPNLVFEARPKGLYRINHKAQEHKDGSMYRVAVDNRTGLKIYSPVKRGKDGVHVMAPPEERRFFLKAATNGYIEFGAQKYWPKFEESTATP